MIQAVALVPMLKGGLAMATENMKEEQWEGVVTLTGIAEKEGGQYVSYCPELGTSS